MDTLRLISQRRPLSGAIENVMGMLEVVPGEQKSAVDFVRQTLHDASYATELVFGDLGDFHECSRKRLAAALLLGNSLVASEHCLLSQNPSATRPHDGKDGGSGKNLRLRRNPEWP